MQQVRPSTAAFAIMMIVMGIWGLSEAAFVGIWAPGIQPASWRPAMAAICSLVSILTGAGLLWRRYASAAASILLAFLCLWFLWCKGPAIVHAPAEMASWESAGETAVIMSAAWALAAGFRQRGTDERRARTIARMGPQLLYGLALIAFGAAHLGYLSLTGSLVPAWLPWHMAWVYFTAATYISAGLALIAGRLAHPAAALSALQMALFGVLVWLPKIMTGTRDADTLNEAAISFALASSGCVIASAIYRRTSFDDFFAARDLARRDQPATQLRHEL